MLRNIFVSTVLIGLFFIHEGFSQQCWTSSGCTGNTVAADDARDCCVGTNDGQSYGVGPGNCEVEQCIVHGFVDAIYEVIEDKRLDTSFRLNVKGMTNFSGTDIEGVITAEAGLTTSQADFESLRPISVIANMADIRLFASNDEITLEYNDSVILTFIANDASTMFISGIEAAGEYVRNTSVVNIIDNDRLQINFEESDYSIEEGGTLSTDIRFQFRNNQNPFSVRLCPVDIGTTEDMGLGDFIDFEDFGDIDDISRATAGADFSDECTDITVPAAATLGTQTYTIQTFFTVDDDELNEVEQSFALTAEIGNDVPFNCYVEDVGLTDCSCFQTQVGVPECFGRSGATKIRITDNDLMIIGFTERSQTVSEGKEPGFDEFPLQIDVATLRVSEREHRMLYRLLSTGTATVVNVTYNESLDFDARFGNIGGDPIEQREVLSEGRDSIIPLLTSIRNDFVAEDDECYSIQISPVDIPGLRELFMCDFVDLSSTPPMSFFCEHTICIVDDDEAFEVGFVKTTYTVPESVGSVEVCVQLIKPQIDILDEFIVVEVIDFPLSMYINGTQLATPDVPNFLGLYPMASMTDFAQQTVGANAIDNKRITELMRIVCYDQPIYEDMRVEGDEWLGLTLDVDRSSVRTDVQPMYNQSAILIQDNDRAVVGLEQIFFRVREDVDRVQLCAIVRFPAIDCPIAFPFEVQLSTRDGSATSPMDYGSLNVTLMFAACETRRCMDVTIVDDGVQEPEENFFYTLDRTPGLDSRIDLRPVDGEIVIVDDDVVTTVIVNDTLTGDPLMTVPILTDPNIMPGDPVTSLCYEVHGEDDKYFNLISDTCVSVNAHYSKAVTGSDNIRLNIVDEIGVRAISSTGDSVDISVGLEDCKAYVNGVNMTMYKKNGIYVRAYCKNRVRIAVPNGARVDKDLVMWVFCTSGKTEDPVTWQFFNINFIRFVVMRGLNLDPTSHGIIGQFWNIPVEVSIHAGLFNGATLLNDYDITVMYPGKPERQFVGIKSSVTWEFEERDCLYVGNSQAGPLGEIVDPNDSVIEGTYDSYEVDSLFSPDYGFSRFDEEICPFF